MPGQGSTFRFTIPLSGTRDNSAATSMVGHSAATSGPTVLVVENDSHALDLITHFLTDAGYRVVSATSGEEALRIARELQPDAITLDIVLPDCDGLLVLAKLKNESTTRDIPVVVVSITDRSEVGFSLGASEWLVKPVERGALIRAVKSSTSSQDSEARKHILIVDDELQAREYLTSLLVPLGFDVATASGGAEGIARTREMNPDLIVLDLMMPDVNGFQVVDTLRRDPDCQQIPILIVTSKELTAEDQNVLRRTVDGVASKGGREELLAQLNVLCPLPEGVA